MIPDTSRRPLPASTLALPAWDGDDGIEVRRVASVADAAALQASGDVRAAVVDLEALSAEDNALLKAWATTRDLPLLLIIEPALEPHILPLASGCPWIDYRLATDLSAAGCQLAVEKLLAMAGEAARGEILSRQLSEATTNHEKFASLIAHDLSSPLRIVDKFSAILATRYTAQLDKEGEEILQYIRDHAVQAQEMIRHLRAFSRLRLPETTAPVDLNELTQDILREWASRLEQGGVSVSVGKLPTLTGNLAHFDRLFRAIIDNAIVYRRGESPQLVIDADELETTSVLTFSDNGLGLEPQQIPYALELFHRCHPDIESGLGVGLAFAKRIVQLYGGRLWMDSTEGKGTTVYVSIPTRQWGKR